VTATTGIRDGSRYRGRLNPSNPKPPHPTHIATHLPECRLGRGEPLTRCADEIRPEASDKSFRPTAIGIDATVRCPAARQGEQLPAAHIAQPKGRDGGVDLPDDGQEA